MKSKLKLEMKKKPFVISIIIYLISLALVPAGIPGAFTGFAFASAMITNGEKHAAIWVLILIIVLITFTLLAQKRNIGYIYLVRGILLFTLIPNAIFIMFPSIIIGIFLCAINLALLIMTFMKDDEYVIVNNLTQEETEKIEKEYRRERKHEIVGNILGFTVVPIALFVVFMATSAPISGNNFEELKNIYRQDLPSEMASEELSKEIIDSIENYSYIYLYLESGWYVDSDLASKMLVPQSDTDDYWIINDNPDLIYHLYYDDWDGVADEYIHIKNGYKYVDPETAKVSKICFANNFDNGYRKEDAVVIDLTEKEIEEIREFIMNNNYDESKTQYYDKEYYKGEKSLDILWYFEGEDALYYEYGEIIRTTDGKYHLRATPSYYTVYVLSDRICERLDAVWQ